MMRRKDYLPEGTGCLVLEGQPVSAIRELIVTGQVVEGMAVRCDREKRLHVRLGGYQGTIARGEAVHPAISGAERDIAVLSCVGRRISCVVTGMNIDAGGKPHLTLSRRLAQEKAFGYLLENALPGEVIPGRVTNLASFGAFVDIGCGIVSLIPLDRLSQSRVSRPEERLAVGQDVLVLVTEVDRENKRFQISHKELLGTWLENAADFSPGDTVTGIVRAARDYGLFIELTPNLTGLADNREGIQPGDAVTVYIQSIYPQEHKIKLQIIQRLGLAAPPLPFQYRITDGRIEKWVY